MPSSDFIPQVCSFPVIPFYVKIFDIEVRTWNCSERTNVSRMSHKYETYDFRTCIDIELGTGLLKLSNLTIYIL